MADDEMGEPERPGTSGGGISADGLTPESRWRVSTPMRDAPASKRRVKRRRSV